MGQQQPSSASQNQLTQGRSALPEMAPVLKLHTAGAANHAHLQEGGTGRVYLYFRGLRFGVDDYAPNSLIGSRSISPSATAGEFACRQMLRCYGYHEDEWPALAHRFLLKHSSFRVVSQRLSK
jgi:hypothetical protein